MLLTGFGYTFTVALGGAMAELRLLEGWYYRPTIFVRPPCPTCGHQQDVVPGALRSPSGRSWPLIGNKSKTAERRMVEAIVEAHT